MDIKAFKTLVFDKAKERGFTEYEIYFAKSESFSVKVRKGQIEEYKNAAPSGLSFRGTYGERTGYAYTERFDEAAATLLVESAKENAIVKEEEAEPLFTGSESYPEIKTLSPKLGEITDAQKIDWAKEMENFAYAADPRVVGVDTAIVLSGVAEKYIANSHGLELYHQSGSGAGYVVVRLTENGSTKLDFDIWAGRDFSTINTQKVAKTAVRKAVRRLGAGSVPSGDYDIVLKNEVVKDILGSVVGNFYAENAQKGLSLLKGKVGTQIAVPELTIRDNILHPLSLNAMPFDSEGVAICDKTVVENGVLKTFLYNQKSARKENRESTGNGFKASYKSSVGTSINNFFIEAGKQSLNEMISKITKGIIITELAGLHSGISSVSGDFSIQAEGFLIENGVQGRPVEQITIAGNFYQLLHDIVGIADDLYFDPFSSIGTPSLWVKNIKVSGE